MTMVYKDDKELFLLGLLHGHDSHGYELNTLLAHPTAPIRIGKANAYQILARFEDRGWTTVTETRDGNRPPRRVYTLTPAGEEAFNRMLRSRLATHAPTEHANVVALNFLELLPRAEVLVLMTQRLAAAQSYVRELRLAAGDDAGQHYGVDYLLRHAEFEERWLTDLIADLSAQAEADSLHEAGHDPSTLA